MEQFWRRTGVALGKQWKIVVGGLLAVTTLLVALGIPNLKFATGQDSYLNPDSQIAIDNVKFQADFGGETVILLFTANRDGVDVSQLYAGDNLDELERLNAELGALVESDSGVYAVITPRTSIEFSHQLLSQGIGTNALLSAASRDTAGAEARNADIAISLARLNAAGEQVVGNPTYNELLIYGNDGYTIVDGAPVAPPAAERQIRASLASTFPNPDPATPNQTAVGGIVLDGNASLDEQSAATVDVLDILDTAEFDGFDLTVTGSPVYLKVINDYLKGGMVTLGAAALAVMAVILALIFRVRWRLLPLLAVLFGVTWAFAIVGIVGIDLSLVTISGLPILIGLGIDFAIQIHNRVEEEVVLDREEHPIAETMSNVAPPLIVATIAAILAFLALQISKVPMIRDFGVLLSIGVAVLVITGIVVPGMVLGVREFKKRTEERGPSLVERVVVWLGGLPTKAGPILIALSTVIFVGGVLAEGSAEIQSDPVEWIDQDSDVVADIDRLEDETGFSTTLGILVNANNVHDQDVIDLVWDFTLDAEATGAVVSSSSLVNTMGKIIAVEGATPVPPTTDDIVAADAVMPADIERVLVNGDRTATQVNLRLAPASLAERADIVADLEADLAAKVAALDLPPDSILLVDLEPGQEPVRATPAGLATVGIGLLENLSANRANLTYLSLFVVGIFLVIRFRSLARSVLALVPVLLAVGVSSLVVGLSGIQLSPLTTVSGPLVVATCAEFSVLILGRYLEERQRGLEPREASTKSAARTGRAFFTSALTTIGGFAVLIGSALPLLRDFGIIVTLNVAIALLAALVVMPPLSVWVDSRGWLGTQEQDRPQDAAVVLGAPFPGGQTAAAAVGGVAMVAGAIAVYATADTSSGEASDVAYTATPLPTTTTTTTTTTTLPPTTTIEGQEPPATDPPPDGPLIDPSGFPSEAPTEGIVGLTLFPLLTEEGVEPNVANCAISTLLDRQTEEETTTQVLAGDFSAVTRAGLDCGIEQETIDAAILSFTGG